MENNEPHPSSDLQFSDEWKITNDNTEEVLFFPTKQDAEEYKKQLIEFYRQQTELELKRRIQLIGEPQRATVYDNSMHRFEPLRDFHPALKDRFVKCVSGLVSVPVRQEQEVSIEGQLLVCGDTIKVMFASNFGADNIDNRWDQWFVVNNVIERGTVSRYTISLLYRENGPRVVIPIQGQFWFAIGSHLLDERGIYTKEETTHAA